MSRPVPQPTELELLANLLLGPDPDAQPLPEPDAAGVHGALDAALTAALSREPCLVSFSGGRDSSAVLALATTCARRHGLAVPVPAIMRFPGAPASDETAWQEAVLAHLQLDNAEVLTLRDELDGLGPAATRVLRRHGVVWPGNAYMHRPVLELARGGTVLTGIGGDELFTTTAPRRSLRQLALAALPGRAREALHAARRPASGYGWLTPVGAAQVRRALAREGLACPYPWDGALRHWHSSRAFAAMDGALGLVAEDLDVQVVNPLLDRRVLAGMAVVGGRRGFASRTDAMRWLCGTLLPERSLSRATKASFGGAVWGPAVRRFVEEWNGEGLNPQLVDVARLKQELLRAEPDFRTILLVHAGWLGSSAASGDLPTSTKSGTTRCSPSTG